jgi:hypothetical protein
MLAGLLALAAPGCGGDTYCQSGPKYGTQCMSLSDARNSPGQRPPLSSEPPSWYQPKPPFAFGSSAKAAPAPAPYPPGPYPTLTPSPASSSDAGVQ